MMWITSRENDTFIASSPAVDKPDRRSSPSAGTHFAAPNAPEAMLCEFRWRSALDEAFPFCNRLLHRMECS
jgi:hypothetical protein